MRVQRFGVRATLPCDTDPAIYSYGLDSYGLYSYGLYCYELYRHGPWPIALCALVYGRPFKVTSILHRHMYGRVHGRVHGHEYGREYEKRAWV